VAPGRLRRAARILAGLAVAGGVALGAPPAFRRLEFFRVRRIEVTGAHYLAPEAVVAALRLGPKASVFDDLGPLERRLAAVPGVARGEVGRRLPGTLTVAIAEIEPIALTPRPGGLAPMDARGRVLPYDPSRAAPDLPIATAADSVVGRVLSLVREHDPALFARIATAGRVAGDVVLELDGRRLWFDRGATAEDIRAVTAVAQDLTRQRRDYQELDGRFAGQVVVRGMDPPARGPAGTGARGRGA